MSIEFPFAGKRTALGTLLTPIIPVELLTRKGFVTFQCLLDSGADFTLLPRHVADLVGVDLTTAPSTKTFGVEGGGLAVWVGRVTMRLGPEIFDVRCFFSEHDDAPLLLGRMDVFSRFQIAFDPKSKRIRFTKVQPS